MTLPRLDKTKPPPQPYCSYGEWKVRTESDGPPVSEEDCQKMWVFYDTLTAPAIDDTLAQLAEWIREAGEDAYLRASDLADRIEDGTWRKQHTKETS